jgi:hypothetical protein
MAIMQVQMPERQNFLSRISGPLGVASSGASLWGSLAGGGAAAGGAGGGAAGAGGAGYGLGVTPFTPATEGMSPVLGGGQLPPVSSGGQAAGTGASEGLGWSAAGPIALGAGSMAFGAKSEFDYNAKGDKAGNAKYSSHGAGPAIRGDRSMAEAMARRMDSGKMGNPADILTGGKDALGSLKLDDPTKALIGKKLDLGLSQLFKLKA